MLLPGIVADAVAVARRGPGEESLRPIGDAEQEAECKRRRIDDCPPAPGSAGSFRAQGACSLSATGAGRGGASVAPAMRAVTGISAVDALRDVSRCSGEPSMVWEALAA